MTKSVKTNIKSYGKFLKILWERKCGVVISMFYRAFSGLILTALSVYIPKFLLKSITEQNETMFFVGTAVFAASMPLLLFPKTSFLLLRKTLYRSSHFF